MFIHLYFIFIVFPATTILPQRKPHSEDTQNLKEATKLQKLVSLLSGMYYAETINNQVALTLLHLSAPICSHGKHHHHHHHKHIYTQNIKGC
jgi:hypothetical protein